MPTGSAATVASVWWSGTGAPIDDRLLEWPPDVFALTEMLLEHSEAYRFVLSPPAGHHWPPARVTDWSASVVRAGRAWTAWAGDRSGPPPELVATEWAILVAAADVSLDDLADGRDWHTCEAILTLHAIADEACAGMGVAVDAPRPDGCAVRGRARELLARTGSLARIGSPAVRVLPKVRTPAGGISLRSLARYVCVRGPGVRPVWHKVPLQRAGADPWNQPVNILLLPWPLRVRSTDFVPIESSVRRRHREPFGFFQFAPSEPFDVELVERVLDAALDEVDRVDMVVLPESSVPVDRVAAVEAALARRGVGVLVAGVRDAAGGVTREIEADAGPDAGSGAGGMPGNWVHMSAFVGDRWWRVRQNKHHRWSLDESQIRQYHLGGALHPRARWWEAMEIPRREIQFVELRGGITLVALVCEDLARLDSVADLLRSVGPTLVVTVLLDGPQLASRWTARYAGVLADDPGSAVLTLTAFGMVDRSRPDGRPASRVVALWKDPIRGIREIPLEPGAHGVLVAARVDRTARHCADGRLPADDGSHLLDVGIHQVHAAPRADATVPADLPAPELDATALSILGGWAEALVEAGSDGEVAAVLADAAPDAAWRAEVGVPPPDGALRSALAALGRPVDRAVDRAGEPHRGGHELDQLVQHVVQAARDASRRRGESDR